MDQQQKSLKKITLVFVAIILLPLFFYTANQVNSLNESERMVVEIYEQQMDDLLFSVNQHVWDYFNNQIAKARIVLERGGETYFGPATPVSLLKVYDLNMNLLSSLGTVSESQKIIFNEKLPEYFKENSKALKNQLRNDSLGYQKIETIMNGALPDLGEDYFISYFVSSDFGIDKNLVVLLINTSNLINKVIQPKLQEVSKDRFHVNIFYNQQIDPRFSMGELKFDQIILSKKLWIFPDFSLGISSVGESITDITAARLNQSLILIFVLNLVIIAGGIFIYRNINKEVRLAQLKSDFVSNVSHELRTPLSLIRIYSETLEMGRLKDPKKIKQYYKNINHEAERLTHLVNNILSFSRMESGRKVYNYESISFNETVNHILDTYQEHIYSKGFTLQRKMGTDCVLQADKGALSEAFINLLENAIKYSTDRKEIEVSTFSDSDTCTLEIKDYGMGINPINQDKIFEKFFRESSALVHETKGSGLGLSLVKFIMDAHHGGVELKSEPGKGSTFKLVFPLNRQ